jgi:hypothetical protein
MQRFTSGSGVIGKLLKDHTPHNTAVVFAVPYRASSDGVPYVAIYGSTAAARGTGSRGST